MIRYLMFVAVGVLWMGCSRPSGGDEGKWSVRMANSVMHRCGSLDNYSPEAHQWQYDIALLGLAIDQLGDVDARYSRYMERYIGSYVSTDGVVQGYDPEEFNIDRIRPAINLIVLYKRTGQERFSKALNLFVDQMERHPRTPSGLFWHKKIYPNQSWLDGAFMACPFLCQYAREFDQPQWFDEVTFQLCRMYQNHLDRTTGLLYHAVDESKQMAWADPETGHSPHFWGRAMGWYMMALVDVLDFLPAQHPRRNEVVSILQSCARSVLPFRDEKSKCWFQVLNMGGHAGNYLEGSCSSMFTYVFAKGANKGYLDEAYHLYAVESFEGIVKHLVRKDGDGYYSLQQICGACGLGGNPYRDGSYGYYVNEKVVENDAKGLAPFIMAALELNL